MEKKTKTHNVLSEHLQQRFLAMAGLQTSQDEPQKKRWSWIGLSEAAISGVLMVLIFGLIPLVYLGVGLIRYPEILSSFWVALLFVLGGVLLMGAMILAYKKLWEAKGTAFLRKKHLRSAPVETSSSSDADFQDWWKDVDSALRGHRLRGLDFNGAWWSRLPHFDGADQAGINGKVIPLVDPEGQVWLVDNQGNLLATS